MRSFISFHLYAYKLIKASAEYLVYVREGEFGGDIIPDLYSRDLCNQSKSGLSFASAQIDLNVHS